MYFESYKSILFSDTLIPDIFVAEYLPSMDGNCVRIYLYCLFLSKHNKQATIEDLSKKLSVEIDIVKTSLFYLENVGVVSRKDEKIILNDLKEKEMNKLYRMKMTSTPEEAILSSERNKRRNNIIKAINDTFFQSVMSPSWYTDIDTWFDKYNFDEDVMYALFQHCYNYKGLSKNYIAKVAESWHIQSITTGFDLDRYSNDYQNYKDIKNKITKKLKLGRNITEYEEEYIEKWAMDYKYDFEIIEMALKKTTAKTNPNFKYIDAIIADWNKNNLKTKEEIALYDTSKKQNTKNNKGKEVQVPQGSNFTQRQYDDSYYNDLYENTNKKKSV